MQYLFSSPASTQPPSPQRYSSDTEVNYQREQENSKIDGTGQATWTWGSLPQVRKFLDIKYKTASLVCLFRTFSCTRSALWAFFCCAVFKLTRKYIVNATAPRQFQLAFLTPCDQAFNPPFLGCKIIKLAKFCFKNKKT